MSTQYFGPVEPAPRHDDTDLCYRLDVVAADVIDVVRCAGGWLYDRAAAGWQVEVFVVQPGDLRPLQILGAQTGDLDAAFFSQRPTGHELAVSATAFSRDVRIRDRVFDALNHALAGVTLWGDGWPLPVSRTVCDAQYRLSAAARAFKRQAVAAAGLTPDPDGRCEAFLADLRPCVSVGSDLVVLAR